MMDEIDALCRLDVIGSASDNDYNDGDGPDYEGAYTYFDVDRGCYVLVYHYRSAEDDRTEESGGEVRWEMRPINDED